MALRYGRFIALVLAFLAALPAAATVVTASFKGHASGQYYGGLGGGPSGNFAGEVLTGRLRFDTSGLLIDDNFPGPVNHPWRLLAPGSFELAVEFVLNGNAYVDVFDIQDGSGLAYATDDTGQPVVHFITSHGDAFARNAELVLAGALLDGLTLASFHPGPVALADSLISFSVPRVYDMQVALTEFRFDASQVPEPKAYLLWATALAAVAVLRLRTRRSRRSPC